MLRTSRRWVQALSASALIILLGLVVCCALIGGMAGGSSRPVVLESLDSDEETVSGQTPRVRALFSVFSVHAHAVGQVSLL